MSRPRVVHSTKPRELQDLLTIQRSILRAIRHDQQDPSLCHARIASSRAVIETHLAIIRSATWRLEHLDELEVRAEARIVELRNELRNELATAKLARLAKLFQEINDLDSEINGPSPDDDAFADDTADDVLDVAACDASDDDLDDGYDPEPDDYDRDAPFASLPDMTDDGDIAAFES